jgi:hypothetical protein
VRSAQRDRLLAVAAAILACAYIVACRSIEDSMLSDAVGAAGVPLGCGVALLAVSIALFLRSWSEKPMQDAGQSDPQAAPSLFERREPALRTAALVLFLLSYGATLPVLGYALSTTLLIATCAWLAGAPVGAPLGLSAALGGPILWWTFDQLLQVKMPIGSLWV